MDVLIVPQAAKGQKAVGQSHLETERAAEAGHTFRLALLNGQLAQLAPRLASARFGDPATQQRSRPAKYVAGLP